MKVIIFIPTYNCADIIDKTIESILGQTRVPDGLMILDNNSSDGTVEKINELISKSGKSLEVTSIKHPKNIGRVRNWNWALDLFVLDKKYDVMKFVFAGDTLDPICIQEQLKMISDKVPLVTCGHRVKTFPMSYNMMHFDETKILTPENSLMKSDQSGNWIAGSMACPMIHKSIVGDTRFREDMDWAADWLFWTQLSEKGNVGFIHDVLVNFHMKDRKGYKRLVGTKLASEEEEIVRQYIKEKLL